MGGEAPPTATGSRWRPSLAVAVGSGLVLWGLTIGLSPLRDNSFLTHLATGRLLLDHGIPRADPYSYTAAGEPWVVQSWLASALYGLVDRWWGGAGLLLLAGALTATLAGLVWRLTRPATSLVARLGAGALVVGIGAGMWSERPLLIGLVLLAVLLVAAEGGLDPRWLVPAMWVWANAHGSFPLGLAALAVLALGRRLDGEHPRVEWAALRWAVLGTVLAALNPLGPRLLLFPVELLGRSETLRLVVEWQSPTFEPLYQRFFLVELALAVVVLVRRPRWRIALPLVVFGLAAVLALRNLPVASLVLLPGLAAGLAGLGSLRGEERGVVPAAAVLAVVATGAVLAVAAAQEPAFGLDRYPDRALRWAAAEQADAERRWFTTDWAGNYLTAVLGADARVFIDDRVDMYPRAVIDDYRTVQRAQPGWEAVLDRHGVTAVVWERAEPLGALLRADRRWRVAYDDGRWLVAIRR